MAKKYKPVVLAVLDGFGVNISNPESTWKYAKMPTFRELEKLYPFTTLQASGISVGLPWGEEGNSEVGHLTIGAGKPLYHHLPRIITSIHNGSFFQNQAFLDAVNFVKRGNDETGKLHLMGLFSSGSVHAYPDHLYALLDFCSRQKLERVYLHLFTDGKDAPTKEAAAFVRQLEERIGVRYPFAKIATLSGRNFAMDRDENWDRIEKVYKCLTAGDCLKFKDAAEYAESSYAEEITDELIPPAASDKKDGRIEAGDAVIFYNYREDSVRELTSAFVSDDFSGFPREKINNLFFVTMTEYDKRFPVTVAFPPLDVSWPVTRVISEAGLLQLHIAETEKYAHITYFFNGGKETPYSGEERILVPSPRSAHFDQTPEMSAAKITDTILENILKYDFVLVNFANGDMVGHTGNFEATVKAIETVDFSIGRLASKILEVGGALIITADHGNAEEKAYSASGEKRTKHTANPVPLFVIAEDLKNKKPRPDVEIFSRYTETKGVLTDVAPTLLGIMGLKKPADMTGVDLLPKIR
ncbi:phosphoglycerate mutase (2,3-diphosphoglycerate-independent) [Candidatus Giovannonibacteria bacterium RIFCSPLOWO2_12_FULL_44_25]|uniref:2,3-bisphosphoglycerate-independent phosphoglycerate mutase n=3 Tax=Parcubacteria group TaxID=1794811 RepID=A0A1F5W869_9BACT|nr:MAG: phosphoglycerate mutase (2,3-diphosphoglycerate-independent) [Candidatus Giovannonibacteria bacterium GWA2_45_15]OGF59179.1 MAG: phosphoglycerate mutase (2,3-diphosphoglycerate-independent) [Candidatus Giovannonibacteria bacterium RIFCSPHIGHO2_01_45_12]OGF60902.1 MAG: phosphoglycerate mutase (2,3-diphosphoglycerate-independent) [Candidatus Giovannonibacteria bacterium RIFCSPHIGHO2_01_FULL_44_100]OGF71471.1 MAG: phosphoglycerate mutase (2,3-diphosphoglycerate-independent) [Candidatus Giov